MTGRALKAPAVDNVDSKFQHFEPGNPSLRNHPGENIRYDPWRNTGDKIRYDLRRERR
ncbi:hypothetical protein Vi05172_g1336 [Venturia inaequalis]|nr:hypothetical protein Vi05172_g1336 [Venturia inaequalis]